MESFINDARTTRPPMSKAHADTLATKAGTYYKAKSTPRNFCKAIEEVAEGMDLLKAFDDACGEGMDPAEGSNLIVKCAGAMGGPMSGPLAATLATRPVKKMADGTIGVQRPVAKALEDFPDDDDLYPVTPEMQERAWEILKNLSHTHEHYRVVNGRVQHIQDYDRNLHGDHAAATLHQRVVHRHEDSDHAHELHVVDAADRRAVEAKAREMGLATHTLARQGGGLHGRRDAAHERVGFANAEQAARVHLALSAGAAAPTAPDRWNPDDAVREHNTVEARDAQDAIDRQNDANDPELQAALERDRATIAANRAATQAREAEPMPADLDMRRVHDATRDFMYRNNPAGRLESRVILTDTRGTANKFCAVEVREIAPGKFVVNWLTGAIRGQALNITPLTETPVSMATALAKATNTINARANMGYERQDGSRIPGNWRRGDLANSTPHPAYHALRAAAFAETGLGEGTPIPVAAPAPAPAAAPGAHTMEDYNRLRDIAVHAGESVCGLAGTARYAGARVAADAHRAAQAVARELNVPENSGGYRGANYHQGRIDSWQGVANEGTTHWTRDMASGWTRMGTAMDAVNARGEGFSEAFQSARAVIDTYAAMPAGATSAHTPQTIAVVQQKLPALGGGVVMENALRGAQGHTNGVQTLEALHTAIGKVMGDGQFEATPGAESRIADLQGKVTESLGAVRRAMTAVTHAEAGDKEPEEALHAIQEAHRSAAAITAAATATGQPWGKVAERMAAAAVAKVAALKPAMDRIANRPRVADLRYANTSDAHRQASDVSHAQAQANPTSHTHHRTAFDHAKRAAVATYHEALKHQGADRQRLQALANTYADRAKAIATQFATLGRR